MMLRSTPFNPHKPLLGLLCVCLLSLAGCWRPTAEVPVAAGEHVVKMVVLQGHGGSTVALVPIFIDGQGPFVFALDTGASQSVVDRKLAAKLGLPVVGDAEKIVGVVSASRAEPVRVRQWRVDHVELPAATLAAVELAGEGNENGFQGLLGSDILSRFDVITVDYKNQRLVFRPPVEGLPSTALTPETE